MALNEHRPAVDDVRREIAAMPHPAGVLEQMLATLDRDHSGALSR
jgi:hypothetical protein